MTKPRNKNKGQEFTPVLNEREIVLDILMEVLEEGKYSHIVLREVLDKYQYTDKKKRAFITRVTEGTIERLIELDYIINQVSKVKVKKMKPLIRNLIRSAVYQMKYMDSVPNSAICNEAVKLATKRGFYGLKGFVNGVLRNVDRKISEIDYPKDNFIQYCSVKYSMPEWIVTFFNQSYSEEKVEQILAGFYEKNKTTIRVNENKVAIEDLVESLKAQGILVEAHPYLSYAFEISGYDNLYRIPEFMEGFFQVQDISSMLVGEIANPKEGDYIIDVCAAPGGKALHLSDKLKGTGTVEARDLTEYKIQLIEENIFRCQASNVVPVQWDATILDEKAIGKADIVIADLPCSGFGILGKKTDIKYKITKENMSSLVKLQRDILYQVEKYVKPGGKLIYSTCTIHPEENQNQVQWILENLNLQQVQLTSLVGEVLKDQVENQNQLQLLPGVHDSDGFFIAAFVKSEEK